MKPILIAAVVGAIALGSPMVVPPASAQTAKIDPQAQRFVDALAQVMNSRNADQGVALFAPDAVLVDPFGKVSIGKDAERVFFDLAFKLNAGATFTATPIASHVSGNMMWILANAGWAGRKDASQPKVTTHVGYVLVRQGKAWKAQMLTVGFDAPPAAPAPASQK
jgi:ketosteroid isomerase-like protein